MDSGSRGLGSRPGRFTMLCSWAQHFPIKVPLSTQEYKWVLANCWGSLMKCWGIILRWISYYEGKRKRKQFGHNFISKVSVFESPKRCMKHIQTTLIFSFFSIQSVYLPFHAKLKTFDAHLISKNSSQEFSLFRSWSLEQLPDDSMPSTVTCISVEYILCLFSSPLFVCPEFVPGLFPADFPPPRNPM